MASTQALTQAQFAAIVLKMIGYLKSGGTAGSDELAEAYWVINAIVKSMDSAAWFRQRMNRATATITAGNNYVDLATDVISVEAAYTYEVTGGELGTQLIITDPSEAIKNGPLYATGVPTHAWQMVYEVAIDTVSKLYLNRRPDEDRTIVYFYRQATAVMTAGTDVMTLPDEFYRPLAYMTAITLARMHGLPMEMRGMLVANMQTAMNMLWTGQYILDPTALADILSQQGRSQAEG